MPSRLVATSTSLIARMTRRASSACVRLVDAMLPAQCTLCGAVGTSLCAACGHDLRDGLEPACIACAIPITTTSTAPASRAPLCGRCLRRRPAFDATIAAARFEPPFDQVIRSFKYAARLHEAVTLGSLLADRWAECRQTGGPGPLIDGRSPMRADVVVPVPLSRERLAQRGFNQSLEIARVVARSCRMPLDAACLMRIHDTPPQAALRSNERRKNMRGAFHVPDAARARLVDRSIAVVDDVMTTGATLDEVARTLKRVGAASVINLVVARTP